MIQSQFTSAYCWRIIRIGVLCRSITTLGIAHERIWPLKGSCSEARVAAVLSDALRLISSAYQEKTVCSVLQNRLQNEISHLGQDWADGVSAAVRQLNRPRGLLLAGVPD